MYFITSKIKYWYCNAPHMKGSSVTHLHTCISLLRILSRNMSYPLNDNFILMSVFIYIYGLWNVVRSKQKDPKITSHQNNRSVVARSSPPDSRRDARAWDFRLHNGVELKQKNPQQSDRLPEQQQQRQQQSNRCSWISWIWITLSVQIEVCN